MAQPPSNRATDAFASRRAPLILPNAERALVADRHLLVVADLLRLVVADLLRLVVADLLRLVAVVLLEGCVVDHHESELTLLWISVG